MLDDLIPGEPLPGDAKVARFCSYNKLDHETKDITAKAFQYRPGETYLSVDAIDIYEGSTIEQLSQLREVCKNDADRLTFGTQGKFVVAKAKDWVKYLSITTIYRPPAKVDYPEHAGFKICIN